MKEGSTAKMITLPSGMDWEMLHAGVKVVEEWECSGSESAVDLIVDLYALFTPVKRR
jgi:hypothetical protein